MVLMWIFQIVLDIVIVSILARYFLSKRGGILALRERIARELAKSERPIDTPLGSAISTLSEKRQKNSDGSITSMKVALQMDTDSSLFGGQSNLKVNEAKRLINQGLGKREIAQRTGLSHAELALLEKTMLGSLKPQN